MEQNCKHKKCVYSDHLKKVHKNKQNRQEMGIVVVELMKIVRTII